MSEPTFGDLNDGKLPSKIWMFNGRWYPSAEQCSEAVEWIEVSDRRELGVIMDTPSRSISGKVHHQYFRPVGDTQEIRCESRRIAFGES